MKKLICILASAALFVACEQKTEVAAPVTPQAAPAENKTDKPVDPNTFSKSQALGKGDTGSASKAAGKADTGSAALSVSSPTP